jgi:hypothetical protein
MGAPDTVPPLIYRQSSLATIGVLLPEHLQERLRKHCRLLAWRQSGTSILKDCLLLKPSPRKLHFILILHY